MKSTYYVTELAGDRVGGLRSPGTGKTLELSAGQAEHPLRLGHISSEKPGAKKPAEDSVLKKPQRGKS